MIVTVWEETQFMEEPFYLSSIKVLEKIQDNLRHQEQ